MSLKALSDYTIYAKYARYIPKLQRRETWEEQVNRVFDMHERKFKTLLDSNKGFKNDFEFAKEYVIKKRVLGSQRSLQFGGPQIEKHNLKLYNCSGVLINDIEIFNELFYVLLCGCGVGFSVQKHHVAKLPPFIQPIEKDYHVVVEDSIEGWSDSIAYLLSSYFGKGKFPEVTGCNIVYDFSQIRPAGSLISGGFKAPGYKGLDNALQKIKNLIDKVRETEQKLKPINVYDIIMHISDAVLSGGVRRSACITLFSKDDEEMINAKTGNWFIENPQRGRSNNSVLLVRDDVTKEEFQNIFKSVKECGEPGFVFLPDTEHVVNPCCLSKNILINTDKGLKTVEQLIDTPFKAVIDGQIYNSSEQGFFQSGTKEVYRLHTTEGFFSESTLDHQFKLLNGEWKQLKDLQEGDKIIVTDNLNVEWDGKGDENLGWLLGNLLGDGTFTFNIAYLDYWGEEFEYMRDIVKTKIQDTPFQITRQQISETKINKLPKIRLGIKNLLEESEKYGVKRYKNLTNEIFQLSSNALKGFVAGWFDADGSVQGTKEKGYSLRFASTIPSNLEKLQIILNALGIYSKIYLNRHEEGYRLLPDSDGEYKEYYCKPNHELIISREDMQRFFDIIPIEHKTKKKKLSSLLSNYQRKLYKSKRIAQFTFKECLGYQDVYDCTIPDIHAFDGNGLYTHNCEVTMKPVDDNGVTGFGLCNLTEINGKWCTTEENFYQVCKASAILGTIQVSYTDFKYLRSATKSIAERDALLGCSITGMMDNPEILFNPRIQRKGANIIKQVNKEIAEILNINPAQRSCVIKPAGSTSCVLGTASGIHPHHSRRYFRRVQANILEFPVQIYEKFNPKAVEHSIWSNNNTDKVITFLCEVPQGAVVKNQLSAIELLEKVRLTQQNWIKYGTLDIESKVNHNVSNTITVQPHEWDEIEKYIYRNKDYFTGISLLPSSGDKDYPQAPFTNILTPKEIEREYGDASVFASGLIVDGLNAFDDNLWAACDCLLYIGEQLEMGREHPIEPKRPRKNGYTEKEYNKKLIKYAKDLEKYYLLSEEYDKWYYKTEWIKKAQTFARKYFENNIRRMTYCLKDVNNWKQWCDIKREHTPIDWSQVKEESAYIEDVTTMGAQACAGGKCDISF